MRFSRLALAACSALTLTLLSACSDDIDDSASTTDQTQPTAAANPDRPAVEIPAETPTELVITDLEQGTGPAAREGDTVLVRYVGVRSEDGAEFDHNYDGDPFPVVLGSGDVIAGWDEGLVGIKQGGRRQLDIPSDLAYGDQPRGDVIRAGDALSFIIDALVVIPLPDPADKPDVTIEAQANIAELVIEDLVVGDGQELQPGQTTAMHLIAFRADTGEEIASTWETGDLQPITYVERQTIPGLFTAMEGIRVGGRRQVIIPFEQAFGATGNETFGLPASTDMIIVFDLIAAY